MEVNTMRVALCQIPVTVDPAANLDRVREALTQAGQADLAVFPEFTMAPYDSDLLAVAEPLDGPFVSAVAREARRRGTAVIIGVVERADGTRVYNCAVAIDTAGKVIGRYRKIHLSDAFADRESDRVIAGDQAVVVPIGSTPCGLITCYDLRFPELARALVDQGAQLLVVIAAWGVGPVKEEQWTTLVRARAIENTTWVVAVDKAYSPGDRLGFGRSLVVDPYGVTRADLGPWATLHLADIDFAVTDTVRRALPALRHRRPDIFGSASVP
jgi:deaminated glutathione amidase